MDNTTNITNINKSDLHKFSFELLKNIQMMREIVRNKDEYAQLNAQFIKAKYEAYIEAGFTPKDALELCKQSV